MSRGAEISGMWVRGGGGFSKIDEFKGEGLKSGN